MRIFQIMRDDLGILESLFISDLVNRVAYNPWKYETAYLGDPGAGQDMGNGGKRGTARRLH